MTKFGRIVLVASAALLSACGGSKDLTCDEVQYYQTAELTKRVEAPEGLDQLDQGNEMAMPKASPRPPREPGQPCFDRPPQIKLGD
ncbi:MAG: hypothetical protein ACR2QL_05335 [Woeseiaceae bacterium]